MPDIRTRFHYATTDFGGDLGARSGSAFSLEPILAQSAWFPIHQVGGFPVSSAAPKPPRD